MHGRVFTSLTHGPSPDCRLANAQLKETLESYHFGAFLMEKACTRCPNDDCNTSFMLILHHHEFLRLQRQVAFVNRPSFLIHHSFRELVDAELKIRRSLLDANSVGTQVGPDMANKLVDACPPVLNIQSQTDFMVGKTDTGGQTENLNRSDATCQVVPQPPVLDFTEVKRLDSYPTAAIDNNNNNPTRTLEVQQDDDDVVFIEYRQGPSTFPVATVKREVDAEDVEPIEMLMRAKEIKSEVFEPTENEPEQAEKQDEQGEMEQEHPEQEEQEEEEVSTSTAASPRHNEINSTPERTVSVASMLVSPISSAFSTLSTDSFHTPTGLNTSSSSTQGGSAAKRFKYADVEICQRCFDVTYFEQLDEYVNHILESHVSIHRFKCTVCDRKFVNSIAANHHASASSRCHQGRGEAHAEIVSDITEDSVYKFLDTANDCYTDKFRNIQPEDIAEILKQLP